LTALLAAAVAGYLLGSIPFGLLLTRAAGLGDIRRIGSGNIGATNVLRTGRRGLALATLLLDGGKGAAAVLLASRFGADAALAAAFGAIIGHLFPIWLSFRGGKGVATGLGVILAAFWPAGLAACAAWLAGAALSRRSSVGALAAFAAAPAAALAWGRPAVAALLLLIAALVYMRHSANIRRLIAGTEPRIGRSA
jgi:glycerol-3-phosphate acyltransferase PlsY